MKSTYFFFFVCAFIGSNMFSVWAHPCPEALQARPTILRSVEHLFLFSNSQKLPESPVKTEDLDGIKRVQARIDSGASLSSIDSDLAHELGLDQRIVRYINVRNVHGRTRRPVIRVNFCLRQRCRNTEFTMISRQKLPYPVLVGRNSLKGFLIDPNLGPETKKADFP